MTKGRPERLTVLGRRFSVTDVPEEMRGVVYGLMDPDTRRLHIADDMAGFDTVDTLIHEVMHAIRYTQGRENGGEVEEDYVRSLATGLTNVFRDNPGFLRWIASTLKKDQT